MRRIQVALALAFVSTPVAAQKILPIPEVGQVQAYSYSSKSVSNNTMDLALADEHVVRRTGASFLQLEFAKVTLSEESVLEIESLADGQKQIFDSETWNAEVPHSVYFNGDAVKVRLWAGRESSGDRFQIKSIAVGDAGIQNPLTICGSADNRVPSTDSRIARILIRRGTSVGVCTAWLISANNCFATAGHCFRNSPTLITAQFDVPASSSTGGIRNPATSLQYNWSGTGGRRFSDGGVGNDWGVFTTVVNSSTRRHAGAVRGSYFRFSTSVTSGSTVEGCGADSGTRNFTLQTHTGASKARSGNTIRYRADTRGGNSGSPVTNSSGLAIGVHTHGGCTSSSSTASSNAGTYQGHASFVAARNLLCRTVDLRVDTLTSNSTSLVNGQTYTMSTRIRNYGNGSSGTSSTGSIVLSTNSLISTADPVLRSFTIPNLAANQSYTYTSSTIRIPTTTRAGTCWLGSLADRADVVGEINESNNTRSLQATCRGNLPNLAPLAIQTNTTTLIAGGSLTVGCRMHNTGSAPVGASNSGVYLSTNSLISTADRLLRSYTTPAIAASGNINQNITVSLPANLTTGTCYVGVYADRTRSIVEGNEADNGSRAIVSRCISRPDLVISACTATASGTTWVPGGAVSVRHTVRNLGALSSPSSVATIHVSSNSTISLADMLLSARTAGSLAPNASLSYVTTVRMPYCLSTSATWYLGVYADGYASITEASESNNGRAAAPGRRMAAYTGSARRAEFTRPRARNTNGAFSLSSAQVSIRRGANVPICVSAPRFNNAWVYPIWSGSSTLRVDSLTNLSISLPVYSPRIVRVSGGQARFSLTIPRVPTYSGGTINAYMHTVWFAPDFSSVTSLSGTNVLFNRLTR